ncbi:MAG: GAF domain-containing protein, partial [Anaerolineales bacterium]
MMRPWMALILPSLAWMMAFIEFGTALYVLLLNPRHRANRHVSGLLLILSLNSFGIGQFSGAMNAAQAIAPVLLLAAVAPMVGPMLFITSVILLKLSWFQQRGLGQWIKWSIYGALLLPALLTLADLLFDAQLWYIGLNFDVYAGGLLPTAQYTSQGVGTIIRLVDFGLFPLLTLVPLLYVIIRGDENQDDPLIRKLAWVLLAAQLLAIGALFGGAMSLSPEMALLLANAVFAVTYAYVSFWQMVSERRLQQWQLQARLPMLVLAITLPILVGGVAFVTMRACRVLGYIVSEHGAPELTLIRRQFEATAWIVGGVGVVLTLFLTWLTTRQALHPITALTETALAITAGDLERVAPMESAGEIGLLAEAFNTMTARLRETIASLEARVAERTLDLEVALSETEALYRTSRALVTFDDPAETLQRIVDMIAEVLPAAYVSLVTFDIDEQRVLRAIRSGSGGESVPLPTFEELQCGLVGWAIHEQQPVLSPRGAPDPRESPELQARRVKFDTGDVIVAPMGYRERIVGTITAVNRSSDPCYTQHDVTLLSAIAKQAAAAVDNARLFEQTQSALNETRALYRVAQALISLGDLEELLRAVVAAIAEALPADGVLLVTFDLEAQQVLNYVGTDSSLVPEKPDDFSKLWEGLSGWVLREREPALSPKGRRDPRESEAVHQDRLRNRCGAIIVAPLQYRDKLVGTITALNSIDRPDFIARDVDLMMAMANQAAIAVENARLFDRTQGALAETQALYRVSRSLVAFEDLRELLRAVVNAVAAALSASWVVIITFDVVERRVERIVQGGPYLPPPYTLDFEELWEGLTGWVIREGKPAFSPKGRPDPRESELVRRHREERGGGSMIVAPL